MDSLRAAVAAFVISLAAALIAVSPALDAVRGLSIDILTALRWRAFGNAHDPARFAGCRRRARRGNLSHAAVRGLAERHLDARNRPRPERA